MITIALPSKVSDRMECAAHGKEIRHKKILNKRDVAFLLGGVSIATVDRKIREGLLPPPNIFGLWNKDVIERRQIRNVPALLL